MLLFLLLLLGPLRLLLLSQLFMLAHLPLIQFPLLLFDSLTGLLLLLSVPRLALILRAPRVELGLFGRVLLLEPCALGGLPRRKLT